MKVTDSPNGNDAEGFIDANKTDDYVYDANGNMTADKTKVLQVPQLTTTSTYLLK